MFPLKLTFHSKIAMSEKCKLCIKSNFSQLERSLKTYEHRYCINICSMWLYSVTHGHKATLNTPNPSTEIHCNFLQNSIYYFSGSIDLHSDLVDVGRLHGVCPSRGGLWQRHERVLQETGVSAQHPHLHADWAAFPRRSTEGHDHLHHRCPRQGRGGQDDCSEGEGGTVDKSSQEPALILVQTAWLTLYFWASE